MRAWPDRAVGDGMAPPSEPAAAEGVSSVVMATAGVLRRIHNPRGRECGCSPDCWCQRTQIGRLVRWWFPGRYFGMSHHSVSAEWKRERFERSESDTPPPNRPPDT